MRQTFYITNSYNNQFTDDFGQNKREVNKTKKYFSLVQKQTIAVMKEKDLKHGETLDIRTLKK